MCLLWETVPCSSNSSSEPLPVRVVVSGQGCRRYRLHISSTSSAHQGAQNGDALHEPGYCVRSTYSYVESKANQRGLLPLHVVWRLVTTPPTRNMEPRGMIVTDQRQRQLGHTRSSSAFGLLSRSPVSERVCMYSVVFFFSPYRFIQPIPFSIHSRIVRTTTSTSYVPVSPVMDGDRCSIGQPPPQKTELLRRHPTLASCADGSTGVHRSVLFPSRAPRPLALLAPRGRRLGNRLRPTNESGWPMQDSLSLSLSRRAVGGSFGKMVGGLSCMRRRRRNTGGCLSAQLDPYRSGLARIPHCPLWG